MAIRGNGAAFATWTFIDPEQLRWTSGADFFGQYSSSPGNERCFCRQCGSPLAVAP